MDSLLKQFNKLYFACMIVGIVSIFGLTLLGKSGLAQTLPLFLMVVLLIILIIKQYSEYFDEEDSDSFYYMGFIFTVGYLISAFLDLALGSDGDGGRLKSNLISQQLILKTFGMGLVTTFIGLVGRIVLLQIQRQPVDPTETAVTRLNVVAMRLTGDIVTFAGEVRSVTEDLVRAKATFVDYKSEIEVATRAVSEFSLSTVGAREGMRALVEVALKLSETSDRLSSAVNGSQRPLMRLGEEAVAASDHIGDFSRRFVVATNQLTEGVETHSNSLGHATHALSNLAEVFIGSSEAGHGLSNSMNNASRNLGAISSSIEESQLPDMNRQYAVQVGRTAERLSGTTDSLLEVGGAVREVLHPLRLLGQTLNSLGEHMNSLDEHFSNLRLIGGIVERFEAIHAALDGFDLRLVELTRQLSGVVEGIGQASPAVGLETMNDQIAKMSSLINEFGLVIPLAARGLGGLTSQIKAGERLLEELIAALEAAPVAAEDLQKVRSAFNRVQACGEAFHACEQVLVPIKEKLLGVSTELLKVNESRLLGEVEQKSAVLSDALSTLALTLSSTNQVVSVVRDGATSVNSVIDDVESALRVLLPKVQSIPSIEEMSLHLVESQKAVLAVHQSLSKITEALARKVM